MFINNYGNTVSFFSNLTNHVTLNIIIHISKMIKKNFKYSFQTNKTLTELLLDNFMNEK